MITRSSLIALVAAGAIAASDGPANAATCFDKVVISQYNPALIRAIQQRLQARGLYAGEIDGRAGPATRSALARLTGWSPKSDFRLGVDLVEQIFGPGYGGIYHSEDQDDLMKKLGVTPDPGYRSPCDGNEVRVVDR